MANGFPNRPRILRGAFVEYASTGIPLSVVFQFNPVQIARSRSINYSVPGEPQKVASSLSTGASTGRTAAVQSGEGYESRTGGLRKFHQEHMDLNFIRDNQVVQVSEEIVNFDIRLDATDLLDDGDPITERLGISPQLAALEQMAYPKNEGIVGALKAMVQSGRVGFRFTETKNPPLILFIWGRKRVLPVNITSMNVTETEFNADLNPLRATVAVSLMIIESPSAPYSYTQMTKSAMAVLAQSRQVNLTEIQIPGVGL